jgi:phosphopentomutase
MNKLQEADWDCIAVGKINDIFTGEGVTESIHTVSNADGMTKTIAVMTKPFRGLCFTNLVEFDSLYGHRRDPVGYARALAEFDHSLPELMALIGDEDLLILSADHGNDPIHAGTDHTREYVPLLVWNPNFAAPSSLGERATFADLGATIADNFAVEITGQGKSFLIQLN